MAGTRNPVQTVAAGKSAGAPRATTTTSVARPIVSGAATTIRVCATRLGYYADVRRRPGDVFTIPESRALARWMERVDGQTPEHQTGPQDALNQQIGDIRAHGASGQGSTSDADDE
jgi:hypothetical protein